MGGEPVMRRRPLGAERRKDTASRERVAEARRGEVLEVVSSVVSELSSHVALFVNELGLKDMKPWGEFFARFKAPRAWNTKVLDERITTNFLHYRGNYSVVAAGLLVVGIVSNYSVVLALLCCALLLTFLFPVGDRPRVVRVGERRLQRSERLAGAVIGVSCILGLSGAWYVLLFYGGAGVFLCISHAVFRPRSMSSKATRLGADAQAAGGFTIEGAQNFVEGVFGMNGSRSQ